MNEDKIKAEIAAMSDEQKQQLKADLTDLRHVALDLAHEAMAERSAEFDNRLAEARGETSTLDERIAARPAPKVTPADIEAEIASEHYFTAAEGVAGSFARVDEGEIKIGVHPSPRPLSLLTFCVLVLRNGFTVTGESACASPENFDAEVGRKVARAAAISKCWPLLGYALRDQISGHRTMATSIPGESPRLAQPDDFEVLEEQVVPDPNSTGYLLQIKALRGSHAAVATGPFAFVEQKDAAREKAMEMLRSYYRRHPQKPVAPLLDADGKPVELS